jgi:hypothetical protein
MITSIILICALALITFLFASKKVIKIANNTGRHKNAITRYADAALTTPYLVVKQGAVVNSVAICGATDRPLGVCSDEADSTEIYGESGAQPLAVDLPVSTEQTLIMQAAVAITANDILYTAASGQVTNVPVAGCYFVGVALNSVTTQGDEVEVSPVNFGRLYSASTIYYASIATMAGGAASEAVTITGVAATDKVVATITDNVTNDNVILLEAKPTTNTVTLLFNEDPTVGVKVTILVLR